MHNIKKTARIMPASIHRGDLGMPIVCSDNTIDALDGSLAREHFPHLRLRQLQVIELAEEIADLGVKRYVKGAI
jgi:hypothetical protein